MARTLTSAERLDPIRDRVHGADRCILIARDLADFGQRRLTQREVVWLRDQLVRGSRSEPIPFLQPREYDALIRALLREVRYDDQPREIE